MGQAQIFSAGFLADRDKNSTKFKRKTQTQASPVLQACLLFWDNAI